MRDRFNAFVERHARGAVDARRSTAAPGRDIALSKLFVAVGKAASESPGTLGAERHL